MLDGDHALLAPLKTAGIVTVETLCALTASEVRHRPGIGPKRLQAIVAALERHGRCLAVEPDPAAKTPRPGMRRLTDGWCRAVLDAVGQPYRWTPSGPDSDQRAAAVLYDAVGWGDDPADVVRADVRGTVDRYLAYCGETGRVPTLPDLVRQLARWRQEPGVRERGPPSRASPTSARAAEQHRRDQRLAAWALQDEPDHPTTEVPRHALP